ncbi:SLC13 family permease [Kosmotoga sp. DU53]|uniref:SLC13 family permease n=1 Tax=Kosmotoga sp. DU53 TaxID=1310160 RepID=UPI001F45958B|nr:SLC13 family permease [Kosmotoga sp. DU53]
MIIILSKVIESFNTTDVGQYIDFNTIGLLIGMMIIIAILRTTGFFEYVAILVVRLSKGNIRLLFYFFMVTIAVFSAFLDNVTTILLFSPILFLVADSLGVSPVFFFNHGSYIRKCRGHRYPYR